MILYGGQGWLFDSEVSTATDAYRSTTRVRKLAFNDDEHANNNNNNNNKKRLIFLPKRG
jgi:hypothetical protein